MTDPTPSNATILMEHNLRWLTRFRVAQLSYVYMAFLVLWEVSLGFTPFQVLITTFVNTTSDALCQPFTGAFADRFGRKRSLVVGCIIGAGAFTLYGTIQGFGWHVLLATALAAVGFSFCYGADSALAYDSCMEAGRLGAYLDFENNSNAYGALAEGIMGIVGIGLVAWLGLRAPIWLQVPIYLGMIALVWPLRSAHLEKGSATGTVSGTSLRHVLRSLPHRPHLLAQFTFAAAIGNLTFIMVWLTPSYFLLIHPFGWRPQPFWFGAVWGPYLFSVVYFKRYLTPFTRRFGRYGSLAALLVIGLIGYLGIGLTIWVGGLLAIFALYFVRTLQVPLMSQAANEQANSAERATVLSLQRFTHRLVYAATAPIIGWVASRHASASQPNPHAFLDGIRLAGVIFLGLGTLSLIALYRTRPPDQTRS
jgi:MFS family permease